MNYGRQTVMDGLRMAGDKVRDFDRAYATKLEDLIAGDPTNPNFARGVLGAIVGAVPGDRVVREVGDENLPKYMQFIGNTFDYGAPAAGIGIRYGLPAAGVHLGVQGIQGAANYFGGQADEPSPGVLPLDQY